MTALSSLAVLALFTAPADGTPTHSAGARPPTPGETVLVQFSSPQCPHCRAMEPVLSRLSAQGCALQVVDVTQQPEVAQQFRVTGVPTFVALSNGRETGRVVGATNYERLAELWGGAVGSRDSGVGVRDSGVAARELQATDFHSAEGKSVARAGGSPEQTALAATVRLRVEDAGGFGFGTGTIIDTHGSEALVVTCGHLFRESQGKGKISADVYAAGSTQTVEGQLIAYDLDRDIALLSLRMPVAVKPVSVAPPGHAVRPQDRVFTIGCDKGADPSVRQTQITAVNKYRGKPNYTAAGQPVDGRSGGGLFTADGLLIGICNAADPADDEGLYAGLASIHWQLDQIGQSEIYQRAARGSVAASAPPVATGDSPGRAVTDGSPVRDVPPVPVMASQFADELAPAAADDDSEIVFIVRSKRNPQKQSEVYVVDQAPRDLVARISYAARASGQQRAALARRGTPAGSRPTAAYQPSGAAPVVRGQLGD